MRLFGRKSGSAASAAGIREFWSWWDRTRSEIDALADAEETGRLAELIGPAVAAIHSSLEWEITPGRGGAARALVVTAAGDAELRPIAHRWAKAAPPADARWEFHPSRQADPDALEVTVDVGGYDFDLKELTFGLRVPPGTPRVNVTAYHPIFTLLEEDARMDATLMALDRLLGEDEVARWIGEISTSAFQPMDPVAAVHLPGVVADVASGYAEEQWALLEGTTAGGARLVATARHPLRSVDYPLFDQHIAIVLPYRHADDDGLPAAESLESLRAFEERLTSTLTVPGGSAVLAAHVSAERRRVVHLYADSEGDAAARAKELAAQWREGRASVTVEADPEWAGVAPFLS
ncbi:DUF695 domain-containing protein [Thermostaphylospora chromogena]|uniref:DUF695 domain-containing protein n=1 Tax=Thermostaphylospora chromogena TaxID=35622 RepID=A0A1H1AHE9_9ACTN|nr:DUF695 domain-containing protein [Thermostaphylospora chromogena]SDQ39124.1 Family of unknown function [Thermostaphylospora chromogena]